MYEKSLTQNDTMEGFYVKCLPFVCRIAVNRQIKVAISICDGLFVYVPVYICEKNELNC